jgi:hypothetical protein
MYLYEIFSDSLQAYQLTKRTERSLFGDHKRFPVGRLHITIFEDREEAIDAFVKWIDTYHFAVPEDARDLIRRVVEADLKAKEAELNAEQYQDG